MPQEKVFLKQNWWVKYRYVMMFQLYIMLIEWRLAQFRDIKRYLLINSLFTFSPVAS